MAKAMSGLEQTASESAQGRRQDRSYQVATSSTSLMTACIFASVLTSVAFAAEPTADSLRYSDNGLLDAARSAAATSASSSPTATNTIVNIGMPPADELRVLEARREAELKRLSEKLKRASAARKPQQTELPAVPEWATEVAAAPVEDVMVAKRFGLGARPSQDVDFSLGRGGRATVLMVLTTPEPRARNAERGADPILCVTVGCYVSNGAQAPASYHSLDQSLSIGGRLGRGAGDCNHSTVCVYRNVDLGTGPAMVQPINLRFVRHDRREQREVSVDDSCRVIGGHLSCSRPVRGSSYTLWVVPEALARDIGPEMLTSAVSNGLRTAQTAELPWIRQ